MTLSGSIDYTYLKAAGQVSVIEKLCADARESGYAAVCVYPADVRLAASLLDGSMVKVCTVVDFPLGAGTHDARVSEARQAIADGARELDFVLNRELFRNDPKACLAELTALAAIGREGVACVTKLIIECCELTREEKIAACQMAKRAGFDFVKTSTGFGSGGATIDDVKLMRETVGSTMGVKAAGGIRDCETALAMLEAGATRIGTSARL